MPRCPIPDAPSLCLLRRPVFRLIAAVTVACSTARLQAQSVPLDDAGLAHLPAVARPRASLTGPALDSALVQLEFAKWALGNAGRMTDTESVFADRFVNVGLGPTGVRRLNKPEVFAMLRSMHMPPMPMELGDWKVIGAGSDARLVSYALRAMGGRLWVSSLWVRQPDGWATVFYQITPDTPMPVVPRKAGS
jgi:hypothetical protein